MLKDVQKSSGCWIRFIVIIQRHRPAWSDAKQQITPEVVAELLGKIVWRKEDVNSEEYHAALEKLRQQINHLDDEMMQLLGQRMSIADKIGQYKRANNITILQTNRWNEILERSFQRGDKLGLSKEFITRYLDAVHMESINHQNKIMICVLHCGCLRCWKR